MNSTNFQTSTVYRYTHFHHLAIEKKTTKLHRFISRMPQTLIVVLVVGVVIVCALPANDFDYFTRCKRFVVVCTECRFQCGIFKIGNVLCMNFIKRFTLGNSLIIPKRQLHRLHYRHKACAHKI